MTSVLLDDLSGQGVVNDHGSGRATRVNVPLPGGAHRRESAPNKGLQHRVTSIGHDRSVLRDDLWPLVHVPGHALPPVDQAIR